MSVSMELPDIDSVVFCSGDHHTVLERVEHSID